MNQENRTPQERHAAVLIWRNAARALQIAAGIDDRTNADLRAWRRLCALARP